MTFQFDTSGEVIVVGEPRGHWTGRRFAWSDLDAFTQGYVEALFASETAALQAERKRRFDRFMHSEIAECPSGERFSNLAPETLAQIMGDCERQSQVYTDRKPDALDGSIFWDGRQNSVLRPYGFPPLTPYLGEDGKVYLREGAR